MSLIVGWIFHRFFEIKRLKDTYKISSKSRGGGATDVYVKISKDKNS